MSRWRWIVAVSTSITEFAARFTIQSEPGPKTMSENSGSTASATSAGRLQAHSPCGARADIDATQVRGLAGEPHSPVACREARPGRAARDTGAERRDRSRSLILRRVDARELGQRPRATQTVPLATDDVARVVADVDRSSSLARHRVDPGHRLVLDVRDPDGALARP